jgi:serine/alanine adding enzyme
MRIVHSLDESVWRHFVDNHPQSNIFHTPEMFQVFARARGHRPTLWAAVTGQGEPLALLLPVQVSVIGGPVRFLTTRAILYGSLLCVPGAEGKAALHQ